MEMPVMVIPRTSHRAMERSRALFQRNHVLVVRLKRHDDNGWNVMTGGFRQPEWQCTHAGLWRMMII